MSDPYLGEIRLFAGTFAPKDWMLCEGQQLLIAEYTALYSLLSVSYGGDGRNTFCLPDLRGRAAMCYGQSIDSETYYRLGLMVGNEAITLMTSELPAHTHNVACAFDVEVMATKKLGLNDSPANQALLAAGDNKESTPYHNMENYVSDPPTTVALKGCQVNAGTPEIQNTGGGLPHENMQPWIAINYIICVQNGMYPPRS